MKRELTNHLQAARRIALATAVAALAATAAPAAAGAVTIGPGNVFSAPGVAVDAAGTAYIAWRGPESGLGSLQFCRLPRGASACDVRQAIAAPGDTVTRAFVVVSGARVVVLQYRYGVEVGMYSFTSADRGATFGPAVKVGTIPFAEAVPGPGDTLSGVTNAASIGGAFQNVPLAGGAADTYAALWGTDLPYNGAVGLVDAATPLAIFGTGSDVAQFRRYSGSGSLNDAASWSAPGDLGIARYPKLAGGPIGLALLASNAASPATLYARKFNGTTFGAPATITTGVDPPSLHAFQDAAGRIHAVFVRNAADGLHLDHAVSDDIATWRSGTVLVQSVAAAGGISGPRIATAPDHIGVIAWNAGNREIRVVPVGPDVQVAPKKLSATGSATRGATKVIVKIAGTIALPTGVTKAAACSGSVKVSIKRATTLIASKTAKVRATCNFSLTTSIAKTKVRSATRLRTTYSFGGNKRLKPLKRSGSLKVK